MPAESGAPNKPATPRQGNQILGIARPRLILSPLSRVAIRLRFHSCQGFHWPPVGGRSILRARMGGRIPNSGAVVSCDLVVANRLGIHARPAAMFVRTASRYQSEILVEKDGERINGKSIMGLMMLAAGPGSRLRLQASGDDAAEALVALEELITVRKFDEE